MTDPSGGIGTASDGKGYAAGAGSESGATGSAAGAGSESGSTGSAAGAGSESGATGSVAGAAAWVAGFAEGWRAPAGPREFAAHFRPMLAPDVRLIQPQLPTAVGHRAFEEGFVKPLFGLIPDLRGRVERWGASGDSVYIELALQGTLGRRPISWRVCDRVTLRDGVAVERESYVDPTPLMVAVLTRPPAWPRYLRLQLARLVNRLRNGGSQ